RVVSSTLNAARTLLHAGAACVKLQVDCQRVRVKIELDHGPINSPLMFALSQKQTCGCSRLCPRPLIWPAVDDRGILQLQSAPSNFRDRSFPASRPCSFTAMWGRSLARNCTRHSATQPLPFGLPSMVQG